MIQPFAYPTGPGSAAMRGFGATIRIAQTIGIEWFDYAKQSSDDAALAMERLSGARSPTEAFAIQAAYLRTAAERFTQRSAVIGGLLMSLTGAFASPLGEAGPRRSA